MKRDGRARVLGVAALLALAAGCASDQPAEGPAARVAAPRVTTRVRYQLGGPLRGPRAPGPPLSADAMSPLRALTLDATIVALAAPPRAWDLAPLSSQTRVVMSEGEQGDQLRPTPRAIADARAGLVEQPLDALADAATDDRASRGTLLRNLRACLIAGATTVIELIRDEPPGPGGQVQRERVAFLLGRRADSSGVDAAVEHQGRPGPHELVELASPIFVRGAAPATWVAVLPSPFAGEEAKWIALIVRPGVAPVAPVPGAAIHEETVAEAVRDLAAQAQMAHLAVAPVAPPPELPDIDATRRALWDRSMARRGLYALASATDARTAEAVAVATDDHTMAPIASAVAAALGSASAIARASDMGIVVEKATLKACQKALGVEPVPADLVAALEWRGGAALRLLPSFALELEKAKTLDALEATLVTINVRLLLDASPSVRARAARWLGARMPLEGYSAIAPSSERRAAVEKIKKRLLEGARDGK